MTKLLQLSNTTNVCHWWYETLEKSRIPVLHTIENLIYAVQGKSKLLNCMIFYVNFTRSRLAAASWVTRKWAAALQAVEEKARILLSRPEFGALVYYTDEYAARHMTVDAFVQCMTELLNTPDKVIF